MIITFKEEKLKALVNDDRAIKKKLGDQRAKILKQRLDQLQAAESLEDLRYAAGHYHELTHNRKGQWACDLDQPYRLIFEPHENPVPADKQGRYLWIEIHGVEIIEMIDYH